LPVLPSSLPSSEQRLVDVPPTTYTDTHINEIANLDLVGMTRRGIDMERTIKSWICMNASRFSMCVRRVCAKMHALSVGIRSRGVLWR
jgi:hypothetical protein